MRLKSRAFLVTASVFVLAATAARADVTISTDATANMSCSAAVCQPTASDAVLNASDLENMLASGNVTVTTTGSGVQAASIDVTAKLGWSANALTLDAYQSLNVTAPVTVKGKSGLSILTNDGGSGGELAFFGKGHVRFKSLLGKLTINGTNYTLVNSIASLAAAIRKEPSGNYALAATYDASKDGAYSKSPIATIFKGALEGLGNRISKLRIVEPLVATGEMTGLFAETDGVISDVDVIEAKIKITRFEHKKKGPVPVAGFLAGANVGSISRSYSTGTISAPDSTAAGGVVGENYGVIAESFSNAKVQVGTDDLLDFSAAGGLVGVNDGHVEFSYTTGAVAAGEFAGGLVGFSGGPITNSYATGKVNSGVAGGLVGFNYADAGTIAMSYSTGKVTGAEVGGLIGQDQSPAGNLSATYWDMDTSGVPNPDQGAGSPLNDPGITGLTTVQLQSGLPAGFDPAVWGEGAGINKGLPYLLTNPPK